MLLTTMIALQVTFSIDQVAALLSRELKSNPMQPWHTVSELVPELGG